MQWLNKIADKVESAFPEGEITVSSGVSPSGVYHVGTLREVLTADAVLCELRHRGRSVRHIHYVDDLDGLRKIPAGIAPEFEKYLGQPLADIPSPDGKKKNWAEFFLADLISSAKPLGIDFEVVRSSAKYRSGYMVPAIEKVLDNLEATREVLQEISGRSLDDSWSPIQVKEKGYLKKRRFISLDNQKKILVYEDANGAEKKVSYAEGDVKLDWRLDWPARWWLLEVQVEPFGRDHASSGGSYDTGVGLMKKVFKAKAPLPISYDFINRSGQTKKMSKSAGDTLAIADMIKVVPPEVLRYFVLRYPPEKLLFFNEGEGLVKLIDDFANLLAKKDKTAEDQQLIRLSLGTIPASTVSNVPFSHLVASYQAALKNPEQTLQIISRTEHQKLASDQAEIIKSQLKFIDKWLENWAPEDVKFELVTLPPADAFTAAEKLYLKTLAEHIEKAPADADGEWFHKTIYAFKDTEGLNPKQLFSTIYQAIIGKQSGPRAGWFLSILPREWLIKRLKLEA